MRRHPIRGVFFIYITQKGDSNVYSVVYISYLFLPVNYYKTKGTFMSRKKKEVVDVVEMSNIVDIINNVVEIQEEIVNEISELNDNLNNNKTKEIEIDSSITSIELNRTVWDKTFGIVRPGKYDKDKVSKEMWIFLNKVK